MAITLVRFVDNKGEFRQVDVSGSLLEGLEYVKSNGIHGAKVLPSYGGDWIDVDSFMEAGRRMFEPISAEESARRDAEWEANHPNGLKFTLICSHCSNEANSEIGLCGGDVCNTTGRGISRDCLKIDA